MTSFNWHKLDRNSFLSWMVIHLVAVDRNAGNGEDVFDELSDLTEHFTEIDMKISINGIDIPVDTFVDRIQGNMKYYARKASEEISDNLMGKIQHEVEKIEDVLATARDIIQSEVDFLFQE